MIKATPAPSPKYPQLVFWPYIYAAILGGLAVVQLMGLGGFDFAGIRYQTPGVPGMIVLIAGLEIFALPFLLRLHLSTLARFLSGLFSLVTPLFILAHVVYLSVEEMMATSWPAIIAAVALVAMSILSFIVLDGQRALRFPKK